LIAHSVYFVLLCDLIYFDYRGLQAKFLTIILWPEV